MNTSIRRALRMATGAVVATGLMVLGAGAASAHVTVSPSSAAAGSYTVLAFSVPHGCDGSPTTKVTVKIPEQVPSVTPTVNSNWTIEKKMVNLSKPIDDGHGGKLTERVDQVVYTAKTPLPADMRDVFELSVKLPETVGKTLTFPTVQTCEKGETAWIETAPEGQPEPDHPAPAITLTAATDGHDDTTGNASDAQAANSRGAESSTGTKVVAWVALGVAVLGLALGAVALRRRPSNS